MNARSLSFLIALTITLIYARYRFPKLADFICTSFPLILLGYLIFIAISSRPRVKKPKQIWVQIWVSAITSFIVTVIIYLLLGGG